MSLPTFIFALLVVSCAVAAPRALAVRELAGNDAIAVEAAMVSRHEKWMAEHGRTYADEEEKARRLEVFRANAKFIDSFNAAEESSHRLATNRFADLTVEEFRAARTGLQRPAAAVAGAGRGAGGFRYENFSLADAAGSMDWRAMGAVTGVKDQGSCGTYNQHDNTGTHATADAYKLSCRTLQAPEHLPPGSSFFRLLKMLKKNLQVATRA